MFATAPNNARWYAARAALQHVPQRSRCGEAEVQLNRYGACDPNRSRARMKVLASEVPQRLSQLATRQAAKPSLIAGEQARQRALRAMCGARARDSPLKGICADPLP